MKSCVPRQQSILLHNLGTKQPIASIFLTAAQLNIGISISGLISIFIKCEMCRVFSQRCTMRLLSQTVFSIVTIQCCHFILQVADYSINRLHSFILPCTGFSTQPDISRKQRCVVHARANYTTIILTYNLHSYSKTLYCLLCSLPTAFPSFFLVSCYPSSCLS